MSDRPFAWVTHAPADYLLVFTQDPDGPHVVVGARCEDEDEAWDTATGLEGAELSGAEIRVYCTVPGDVDRATEHFARAAAAAEVSAQQGTVEFVAIGSGSGTTVRARGDDGGSTRAHLVISCDGEAPRCYRFTDQCERCGEFRGAISVMPRGAVMIDTRQLRCRCDSIPCHYCPTGTVRRPVSEHFDPERRAGHTPWFGYLVPCGRCQAAGRGPRVLMSHKATRSS